MQTGLSDDFLRRDSEVSSRECRCVALSELAAVAEGVREVLGLFGLIGTTRFEQTPVEPVQLFDPSAGWVKCPVRDSSSKDFSHLD